MKRILTLAVCLGLASAVAAQAKDKDKGRKKAQHEQVKFEKRDGRMSRSRVHAARIDGRVGLRRLEAPANVQVAVGENSRLSGRVVTRRGPANYSWSYDEARRYYNRGVRRDRGWYSSRYSRFALFAGGYYYFDRGYWYPAYGYDPVYSTYRFDEPIYGYNSLDPQRVIVNVQRALRRSGYYVGAVDGMIGPMTRAALARYQRDRGLYVTRAIDGPTLAALGLT